MRIQHNIMAMNSYRNYTQNTSALSKNLEKLSSGYKINRAGDDAAGLAISEKMRAQVTGLKTAQKNAKDGISLVQTAEGALTEVHSMLNRMVELADQSANGTYDNDVDRANLQKEFDALRTEIDRVADASNFNGIKLLDGSLGGSGSTTAVGVSFDNATTGTTTAAAGKNTLAAVDATIAKTEGVGSKVELAITYTEGGSDKTLTLSLELAKDADGNMKLKGSQSGKLYAIDDFDSNGAVASDIAAAFKAELGKTSLADKFTITESSEAFAFEAKEKGTAAPSVKGAVQTTKVNAGTVTNKGLTATVTTAAADANPTLAAGGLTAYTGTNASDAIFTISGQKFVLAATGTDLSGLEKGVTVLTGTALSADHAKVISQKTGLNVTESSGTLTFKSGGGSAGSGGLTLQIGEDSSSYNQLTVSVNDMHAAALGIGGISIADQSSAQNAVDSIKTAINSVSSTRGDLGALQNRLEHTISNLSVMQENIQDAEATIRDVDVAEEMMAYTKNNILVQSAQAMLAQANQVPQGVLQLLQ